MSQVELLAQDRAVLDELFLLTLKPRTYVLNVSEDVLGAANDLLVRIASGEDIARDTLEGELKGVATVAKRAKAEKAEAVAVSARLEAELAELRRRMPMSIWNHLVCPNWALIASSRWAIVCST